MNSPTQSNDIYLDIFKKFRGCQQDLIPILQKVQEKFGYIHTNSIHEISKYTGVSENEIYGVASFYSMFRFHQPGRNLIRICLGTACHVQGAPLLVDEITNILGIQPGQTTPDGKFELEQVACLGCCALSPVLQVNQEIYSKVNTARIKEILELYE